MALPAQLADVGAECSLLSAAAYREEWLLDVLQETTAEDYTRNETRAFFSVMQKMFDRGEKVSIETISLHGKELNNAGYIQGRDLTFSDIVGNPPMKHDFSGYLQSVKEMTARRKVLRAAETAAAMIRSGEMSGEAFAELERVVIDRTAFGMTREILSPADMADAITAAVNERMDKDARKKRVIYTSFGKLNACAGGFEKGDLIILSAESGAGKSAFSMNLAYGIACFEKRPLLYLNSEMSKNQNALRWASFMSKVSHSSLRNGRATEEEAAAAIETAETMRKSNLWTINIPDMQISSVLAEVRRAKAQHNIEMAIVDYIGRMDALNARDAKEWQVMKSAAQRLKTMAIELQIAVVMVAQLTSDGARLAQSSYMAHEADLWINIAKIKDENRQSAYPWNYYLNFRKARNVEQGREIPLRFDGDTLTFTDKKAEAETMAKNAPPVVFKAKKEDLPL